MFRFFVRLFALFGLLVVVALAGGGVVAWKALHRKPAVPEAIVLRFDLDKPLVEHIPDDPLSHILFGRRAALADVVDALDRGRTDKRVKGLVMRIATDEIVVAQTQDLRDAVARFRASGRFAYAFSESYGEAGPGQRSYTLATGFDQVWLQPVGMVGLTGIGAQVPFLRGTLDRLGLLPQIDRRAEYKTAPNSLTETAMTPPHREMLESILSDITDQMVSAMADGRKIEPAAVRGMIDRGPLLDREAIDGKLVDRLGYYDEVLAAARGKAGQGADEMDLDDYLDAVGGPHESGPTIALIYGTGTIIRGEGHPESGV